MSRLLVFGPGYTASRLMRAAAARGWATRAVDRATLADTGAVADAVAWSTHILSSVPPGDDGADPVLARHGPALAASGRIIAYLSSTGVYGDSGGGWIDESAPLVPGRRPGRAAADQAWAALSPDSFVFRLPGIYGPGRSALDRVAAGTAYRVELSGHVFSRVHVDDIVAAVLLGLEGGPAGSYNLADDNPAPQFAVITYAATLLGIAPPPLVPPAALPPAARAFYAASRRVANGRAKRLLGWRPLYPDFRSGLRALSAMISPASVSSPPATAGPDQR
ncbi:SDR family NAD(P)-dependent oxidoreductase [Sphingomonas flavalba]|uniref:SDR family NAD(P)-dependent oxidoreductase n=1 Tax=Sphingomonas flavalba TaxID=2559804 RepID=UPI0039E00E41